MSVLDVSSFLSTCVNESELHSANAMRMHIGLCFLYATHASNI